VADRNGILSSYDQWTGGDPGLFDVTNFLEANIKDGVLIGGTSTEHKHGTYVGGGGTVAAGPWDAGVLWR